MREITSHRVNPANDVIKIVVTDEPGAGGANHRYDVTGYDAKKNPSFDFGSKSTFTGVTVLFQNGPIAEMLDRIIAAGWTPIMVFEDRASVVQMWRDRGIPCAQVAPGDF